MSKISNQNAYPSANPADGSYIIGTDVTDLDTTKTYLFSGVSTYINEKLTDSSMTPVYASEKILQEVRFAEAVSKGDPVYVSGYNAGQNRPEVQKADASDAAQMPSIGLAAADYAINTNGYVISVGDLSDVNTDTLGVEGDVLYVAAGGGLTVTKPTGSNLIQNVGKISRSNQTNGSIEVFSVGRTNDVPNLSEGKIFVGSAANTIESSFVTLNEGNTTLQVSGKIETTTFQVNSISLFSGPMTLEDSINMTQNGRITNMEDPVDNQDAATKSYVDSRVLSSASVTLTPSQVLSLSGGGSNLELIAAPGANKVIDVVSILAYLDFGTQAYNWTGFGNKLSITTTTPVSQENGFNLTVTELNASADTYWKPSIGNPPVGVNTPLSIYNTSGSGVTQGDSPITFSILYRIVSL